MREATGLWAVARRSFRDVWLAPAIATALGLGLVVYWMPPLGSHYAYLWTPAFSPLLPLVVAAVWGGIATTGQSRARWAWLLARPMGRSRMLWTPVAVLLALLMAGAVLVHAVAEAALPASGQPLSTMLGAIGLAAVAGFWAGAVAESDIERAGIAVLALMGTLGLPLLVTEVADVPWSRIDHALGSANGLVLFALLLPLLWPLSLAGDTLPRRTLRNGVAVLGRGFIVLAFQLPILWVPSLWLGAQTEHGEVLAIVGDGSATPLTLTGSERSDGSGMAIRGVLVGDRDLLNLGRLASWQRDEPPRAIQDVALDPTGTRVAFAVRPELPDVGLTLMVVDRTTGRGWTPSGEADLQDAAFSPDGTTVALARRSGVELARASDGSVMIAETTGAVRILGWSPTEVFVQNNSGKVWAMTTEGEVRTVVDEGRVHAVVGPSGRLAWVSPPSPKFGGTEERRELVIAEADRRLTLELGPSKLARAEALDWLDDEHIAVRIEGREVGVLQRGTVLVPIDGSTPIVVRHGGTPSKHIHGPPQGPWILEHSSAIECLAPDGTELWSEHLRMTLGHARESHLALAWADDSVRGVRVDGTYFTHPLPCGEVSR